MQGLTIDGFSIDGTTLLVIVFIILFFVPQLQHRAIIRRRFELLSELGSKRASNIISMIHRQEQLALFGIPLYKFINIEDSEQVLRAIRQTPADSPIDFIVHTPGGIVLAASQIALALKDHPGKTTVIVPHYAMSGGTLIALAADEIIIDPHAVLGPVDPQIADPTMGSLPAASVVKVAKDKGKESDDSTLIRADIAEKALRQMNDLVQKLTMDRMGQENAKRLADELTSGKFTHDYPITVERAHEIGIDVKVGIPLEVYRLMELYPQPAGARPTVEYIPRPPRAR